MNKKKKTSTTCSSLGSFLVVRIRFLGARKGGTPTRAPKKGEKKGGGREPKNERGGRRFSTAPRGRGRKSAPTTREMATPKRGGTRQHHQKEEEAQQHTQKEGACHRRSRERAAPPNRRDEKATPHQEAWECNTTQSSTAQLERRESAAPPTRRRANHHSSLNYLTLLELIWLNVTQFALVTLFNMIFMLSYTQGTAAPSQGGGGRQHHQRGESTGRLTPVLGPNTRCKKS